jgi:protoporphyrinogen oxidase
MKVAIIGAGFTGLTAAHELAKKGHSVKIFEKNRDIGGLAGDCKVANASIEKAYHHLFRTDKAILNLINEIGLGTTLSWHESKVGIVYRDKLDNLHISPFNGVKDILQFRAIPFIDRLRGGVVTFFLQKYTSWRELINERALPWMQKWAGKNFTDAIWGPMLKGKFDRFAETVSMAWLWARIHIRANSRTSIFAKELLAYPDGGFISIANAMVDHITEKLGLKLSTDWLKLNTIIEKITDEKDHPVLWINGKGETFDALLFTTPTEVAEKLLNKELTERSNKIDYLSAVVLLFTSNQSLSQYYWHSITDPKAPFLVFLQHTNLISQAMYEGQQVYYIGAYLPNDHAYLSMPPEQLKKEWLAYLQLLFPQFNPDRMQEAHVFKFPYAQHIVDTNYQQKIVPYKLPVPHTYLANFAQIFPQDRGTNYSVEEGIKIANLIVNDFEGNR